MKIKLFVTTLLCFCTCMTVSSTEWPTVTLKSVYANKYLAFGSGSVLYDKPVIQTDLFITLPYGFNVDIWNSKSLEGKWNGNLGNEMDLGLGWAGAVKDWKISLGSIYFDEPDIFTLGAGDILYNYVSLSRSIRGWTLKTSWENYVTMPDSGFQGGNLFSLGVGRSLCLWKDRLTLNASTATVYDDGGFGLDDGFLQKRKRWTRLVSHQQADAHRAPS